MCDKKHNHGLIETWITPRDSTRLRSKLVQLAPGQSMPAHTTGPGREEVITCIFGTIQVTRGNEVHTVTAGNAIFIPADTLHAVTNREEDHALYCYVVSVPTADDHHDNRIQHLFDEPAEGSNCVRCGHWKAFNEMTCGVCDECSEPEPVLLVQ